MSGTGVRAVLPDGLGVDPEVPAVLGVFFFDAPAMWAALAALTALTCPRYMVFQARRWASCGPK
ncbi:MAG TPA: hypothetical protein VIJ00_18705, partial [Nakamurella sp.]